MDNEINKEQIELNLAPTSENDLALGKERFTNEHIYESPIKDLLLYGLTPDQIRSSYAEHILYLAIRIKCDIELAWNYKPHVNKDLGGMTWNGQEIYGTDKTSELSVSFPNAVSQLTSILYSLAVYNIQEQLLSPSPYAICSHCVEKKEWTPDTILHSYIHDNKGFNKTVKTYFYDRAIRIAPLNMPAADINCKKAVDIYMHAVSSACHNYKIIYKKIMDVIRIAWDTAYTFAYNDATLTIVNWAGKEGRYNSCDFNAFQNMMNLDYDIDDIKPLILFKNSIEYMPTVMMINRNFLSFVMSNDPRVQCYQDHERELLQIWNNQFNAKNNMSISLFFMKLKRTVS